jgi:phenylacetate-CoA ligase
VKIAGNVPVPSGMESWPAVEEVAGRDYEFLVSATGRRISLTAVNMHDRIFEGLMAVQFFQEHEGVVELRFQPGPQWQGSRMEPMQAGLLKKLGDDFTLVLREVKEVEKTKAGKHRWLISKLLKHEPQRAQRGTKVEIEAAP